VDMDRLLDSCHHRARFPPPPHVRAAVDAPISSRRRAGSSHLRSPCF
jgi:hypothetical protein